MIVEKITINVRGDGDIGAIGAKLCLTAAAEYAEKHGLVIVGERDKTGKVVYWFERRKSHERNSF